MQIQSDPKFEKSFPYANEEEEKKQLTKLSNEVAEIWGQFLKAETHTESNIKELRDRGFYMNPFPKYGRYPTAKRIKMFQENLAKKIQLEYRKSGNVSMTTDKGPEGIVIDALDESGITSKKYHDLYAFFPYRSGIWIRFTVDKSSGLNAISYEVNFEKMSSKIFFVNS